MNSTTFRLLVAVAALAMVGTANGAGAQQCTSGLVYFTHAGHHYWQCNDVVNQATAQARCAAFTPPGGAPYYLARPETTAELATIQANRGGVDRWIGATDAAAEGTWLWTDGSPVLFNGASTTNPAIVRPPWDTGQPDNSGNQDCAQMWQGDGEWDDLGCGDARGFVCEGVLTPRLSCITNGAPCCNVSFFEGREYRYCTAGRSFDAANTDCAAWGGSATLVGIDNALEQQHVLENVSNVDVWIGARRNGGGNEHEHVVRGRDRRSGSRIAMGA